MYRMLIAAALVSALSFTASAQETMILDKSHFYVGFEVQHFGFSPVVGRFNEASGELTFDEKNPTVSKLKVVVKTASVDTAFKARDDHVRSADFLDVAKFPEMTFEVTGIELTAEKAGKITGNLTLKGVTKSIGLEVKARDRKSYPLPAYKGLVAAGFEASGTLNREDFGIGKGEATLTLRADFIKCDGDMKEAPSCKVSM